MDELTREFLIESQEGLDRMERCLTDLEKRPDDSALIAEIFRSVHTIKGPTGFLGYKRLEKLSHAGESLLGQLREGTLAATAPIVTALLQLLDALRFILRAIEANETEGAGDDGKLIQQLEQLQGVPAPTSTTLPDVAGTRRAPATAVRRGGCAYGVRPVPRGRKPILSPFSSESISRNRQAGIFALKAPTSAQMLSSARDRVDITASR
jgi:two-component system chemotaxis sensor kinase CheA